LTAKNRRYRTRLKERLLELSYIKGELITLMDIVRQTEIPYATVNRYANLALERLDYATVKALADAVDMKLENFVYEVETTNDEESVEQGQQVALATA